MIYEASDLLYAEVQGEPNRHEPEGKIRDAENDRAASAPAKIGEGT